VIQKHGVNFMELIYFGRRSGPSKSERVLVRAFAFVTKQYNLVATKGR